MIQLKTENGFRSQQVLYSDTNHSSTCFNLEYQGPIRWATAIVAIENLGDHLNFKHVLNSNVENVNAVAQAVRVLEVFAV